MKEDPIRRAARGVPQMRGGINGRLEHVLKAVHEVENTRDTLEPVVNLDSANIMEPPYSEFQKLMNGRYESAARAVCLLTGENPDTPIIEDHPSIAGAKVKAPHWHTKVQALINHDILLMALIRTREDRQHGVDGRPAADPDKAETWHKEDGTRETDDSNAAVAD